MYSITVLARLHIRRRTRNYQHPVASFVTPARAFRAEFHFFSLT